MYELLNLELVVPDAVALGMRGVIENVLGRIDNAALHLLSLCRVYLFLFRLPLSPIEYVIDPSLSIMDITISGCFSSGEPHVMVKFSPPSAAILSGRFRQFVQFLTRLLLC